MAKGSDRMLRAAREFVGVRWKVFSERHGQTFIDLLELPIKIALSPFTLAFDIAGAAPRGFGIPELASRISFSAIFLVATLGTYDIAMELGKKALGPRNCRTCNGWRALRCTMCKGQGTVHYQVQNCILKSGERPTAECVADAITDNRAKLVCLPSAIDLPLPLPSKECPDCNGTGVMNCPECKHKLAVKISVDEIMQPPWKAYNVMKKMDYPYENIVHSMRDPKIAAFWLITMPQIVGGVTFDNTIKQKIWWAYKESMRYDQLRDVVVQRKPGWEHLQKALVSLDPLRARDDPAIVKNVPYFKAKKALEAEVMKLNVPPRPRNWGELDLPLDSSSWTEDELKEPSKVLEKMTLLDAQRKIADRILDEQWEAKWRQEKLNTLLEEKLLPYAQNMDKDLLAPPIVLQANPEDYKKKKRRRWWIF